MRSHEQRDYIHVMDLAEGHINALDALQRDETFRVVADNAGKGFGGSGGKYRAFNLGRGKGYRCVLASSVTASISCTGLMSEWVF